MDWHTTISNCYNNHHITIIRMIVPEFKLKQDDRFLSVFIRLPYIKVSACEFFIEATTFKFYLKPYLLSLTF
jgi:protein SHQ1